jgi:aspartyl protease family protein
MNKLFGVVFLAVSIALSGVTTRSAAQSECFMQSPDGRSIDLSRLCGDGKTLIETTSGGANPSTSPSFSLPVKRRIGGTPTVEVTFNGKHRYEMLFDTGASATVIPADMAAAIGVKKERQIAANTAGGVVPAYLGRVRSIEAGNLAHQDLVIGISDYIEGLGLLGQDFYGDFDVTIKQDVIVLQPRSASKN